MPRMRPALSASSISLRAPWARLPWCARTSGSAGGSSFRRAHSRSHSPRLLTNTIVERCARISSSRRGSIAGHMPSPPARVAAASSASSERVRRSGARPWRGAAAPRRPRLRHVRHRHPDLEVEPRGLAAVDDRDRPVAAQEARHLRHRPRRGREPDALRVPRRQRRHALERERQVRAALVRCQRVDLVDDDRLDAAQRLALARAEDQVERLGRGDQDLGRVAGWAAPVAAASCRRCAPPRAAAAAPRPDASAARRMPSSGARRLRSMS
jgi:hypothetical protein